MNATTATITANQSTAGRRLATGLAIATLAALALSSAAQASEWQWSLTPYAWAPEVKAEVSVDDQQKAEGEVAFEDLLDATELSAQFRFQGQRGRHGFLLDTFYVDLGIDGQGPLPGPTPIPAAIDADFELTIFEAAALYNPRGDGDGFTLIYGARAIDRSADLDIAVTLAPGVVVTRPYEFSETLYDAMVGAKYAHRFGSGWSFTAGADLSTGDTDLTWQAEAGIGYSFGRDDRYTLTAGYRYFDAQFERADLPAEVDVDATLSGFLGGLEVGF